MASRVATEGVTRTAILVRIPPALRSYTNSKDEVVLEARTVAEVLAELDRAFPGIRDRVVDEMGRRRHYVNIFVNEELVWSSPSETNLNPGDVVHILPSVAGG